MELLDELTDTISSDDDEQQLLLLLLCLLVQVQLDEQLDIRHELIEDVIIKTETKDSCVETDFPGHYLSGYNDENITEDPLDSKIKVESANKNDIDSAKSDISCTICNKKLISKHALACHVIRKHKVPSIYYVIIFRGKGVHKSRFFYCFYYIVAQSICTHYS